MIELSICIPTHNRAALIEESLRQLVPQCDARPVEICVSNNASPDHTAVVLSRYPQVRSITQLFNIGIDRNILAALEERSWNFGAEQSGHLIFRHLSPTGDGLLTGLLVADMVARQGPLAEQCDAAWERVPQDLINIATDEYDDFAVREMFDDECRQRNVASGDVRLLIRPSGTEPLVRVMVEALDGSFVTDFTARVRTHFFGAP